MLSFFKVKRIITIATLSGCVALAGCEKEPSSDGGPLQMRRLTEAQYRNVIRDVFSEKINVTGRFEREQRQDGLLEISSSHASVTESGAEQFFSMATNISSQVVGEENREAIIGCGPESKTEWDASCAKSFIEKTGRLLFRRNLSEDEVNRWEVVAEQAAQNTSDFYSGLAVALSGMLIAPEFLFRMESLDTDAKDDTPTLSAYSKASRLSFLFWDSSPDEALLVAAENGSLHSLEGLEKEIDRLMASPKFDHGIEAFLRDFLGLDAFENLQKDKIIYPVFDQKIAISAEQQLLKFVKHHLITRNDDYRSLFTARQTFMNRPLGMLYQVPVKSKNDWEEYTFPANDPRSGLLSHVGFTALHSHPGRSSATLRGIAIREHLLCQPVAPAPAAVNFTVVQDTNHPDFKTARERLTAHRTDPACAGCHKVIDPIGLAMEHFDGAGIYREKENGEEIDTSGEVDGMSFETLSDLGQVLHDHPAVPACLVNSVYKYAAGREIEPGEREWMSYQEEIFSEEGFRVKGLLRNLATSKNFFKISDTFLNEYIASEALANKESVEAEENMVSVN